MNEISYWDNLPQISQTLKSCPLKLCHNYTGLGTESQLTHVSFEGCFFLSNGYDPFLISKLGSSKSFWAYGFNNQEGRNVGSYYHGYIYDELEMPAGLPDERVFKTLNVLKSRAFSRMKRKMGYSGILITWKEFSNIYRLNFLEMANLIDAVYLLSV